MKRLELSLYDCVFQNYFRFFLKKISKLNFYDSSALCCILIVLSCFNKKENNI